MLDIGKTKPEVLYDFAVLLDAAGSAMIDMESELGKAYLALQVSAWGQLPEKVVFDFTP